MISVDVWMSESRLLFKLFGSAIAHGKDLKALLPSHHLDSKLDFFRLFRLWTSATSEARQVATRQEDPGLNGFEKSVILQ